jgi:EmrB/QacA subfamily drug resistance transporter
MAFIDGSVVNVALPVLQKDLQATVSDMQWVVEAYALFLAALVLVGGSLGDRWGRRRIFAAGVAIFTLASIWCGLAPNTTHLIVARAAQGIGGALLVPSSLAIISATFGEQERGRAIGTWSGMTSIASALGPVLGGFLVERVSWRAVFFINVPLAAIVLLLLFWRVPESRADESGKLDVWGALLVTIGLGALVYGLIEAGTSGLGRPTVVAALGLGLVALLLFIAVEARSANPMMPLSVFRSRTFSGANILTLLLYAGLGGALFFVPFNLIQVQGYSPTAAGAALLPMIVLLSVLSRWSGGLVTRYGAKRPLVVGPLIAAVGFALFAVPGIGGSYWTTFFPAALVLGLGMAISVAPLTTVVMNAIEGRHAGLASGINNAVARTAGLLAVAVLGIVVLQAFSGSLDRRMAALDIPAQTQRLLDNQRVRLAEAEVPASVDAATRRNLEAAIAAAYVDSFRLVMLIAAGLAVGSALSAAALVGGKSKRFK